MPEKLEHLGFKTTWMYIGWLLGIVAIVFEIIINWIPASAITSAMIAKVLTIAAVLGLGVPAVFYIAHLVWMLAYKVEEKLQFESTE